MFGATKEDLNSTQYKEMKEFELKYAEKGDGFFFAFSEQHHGWDTEDWGWFSEVQEFDQDYQ